MRRKTNGLNPKLNRIGWLFIIPSLVLIVTFVFYPMIQAFITSFQTGSAISTLSFSELEAIIHIFEELNGNEGILVASKIADRVGITRSVIVNALRKFESAGVIESRSSGMKGTYIKVLNDVVFDELKAIKASNSNLK